MPLKYRERFQYLGRVSHGPSWTDPAKDVFEFSKFKKLQNEEENKGIGLF